MEIFITGSTGFVGSFVTRKLLEMGHRVTGTGTRKVPVVQHESFRYIQADTCQPGSWQAAVAQADVVINLAGRSIFHLWTSNYKQMIYDSRIKTTQNVVDALAEDKPVTLCNASAVGIYGNGDDRELDETQAPGNDFLATVCRDWEREAMKSASRGHRVVAMRFGVVLGPGGGALEKMIPIWRMGLGGPIGSGKQWFPWIHIHDLMSALNWIIMGKEISGPVNFTGPVPVTNGQFAKALGKVLNRPAFIPVPEMVLKTLLGEFGQSLISSQKAIPAKLMAAGYDFKFPDVQRALGDIVSK